MVLPCGDPRDAKGLERGYREIAAAANKHLIVYLKEENNLGADREAVWMQWPNWLMRGLHRHQVCSGSAAAGTRCLPAGFARARGSQTCH